LNVGVEIWARERADYILRTKIMDVSYLVLVCLVPRKRRKWMSDFEVFIAIEQFINLQSNNCPLLF
jgi:hypothetical protein